MNNSIDILRIQIFFLSLPCPAPSSANFSLSFFLLSSPGCLIKTLLAKAKINMTTVGVYILIKIVTVSASKRPFSTYTSVRTHFLLSRPFWVFKAHCGLGEERLSLSYTVLYPLVNEISCLSTHTQLPHPPFPSPAHTFRRGHLNGYFSARGR